MSQGLCLISYISYSFIPQNNTNVGVFYHCPGYKEDAQAHQKGSMPLQSSWCFWLQCSLWSGELTSVTGHVENVTGALHMLKPDRHHFCCVILGSNNFAGCWGWDVFPGHPEAAWLVQPLSTGNASHWDGSWRLRGSKNPHGFLMAEADDARVGWWALEDSGSLCRPPRSVPPLWDPLV